VGSERLWHVLMFQNYNTKHPATSMMLKWKAERLAGCAKDLRHSGAASCSACTAPLTCMIHDVSILLKLCVKLGTSCFEISLAQAAPAFVVHAVLDAAAWCLVPMRNLKPLSSLQASHLAASLAPVA